MENKADQIVRRIAVTGPESTGKSMLSVQLAHHYATVWVPEFAREYLEKLGRPYVEEDILAIAQGQWKSEMYHQKNANHLIFSDTEFLVTKIWSLVKYKRCHPWIEQMVTSHRYDFYLLCNIDLPWEYDPLREHPEMRQVLFELYIKELGSNELPYAIVSGTGSARLENAIKILEKINF